MSISEQSFREGEDADLKTRQESRVKEAVRSAIAALQPLTSALLGCVTPAEVVEAVVERGTTVLGARAGLVALVTDDGEQLELVRTSGYSPEVTQAWQCFPISANLPLSDAVRQNEVLLFEGGSDWRARYPDMVARVSQGDFQASASLPLSARGKVFGALHFSFPTERSFSAADQEFLADISRQCALALDRAILLEKAERARDQAEDANRRLRFLARASTLLGESLDYQKTLDAIASLAVPDLCDWVTVDLLDPEREGAAPAATVLHLAVAAHTDPAEVEALRELRQHSPIDMTQTGQPPVAAMLSGETVFLPEITPEIVTASARNEEQLRHIERLAVRSLVSVPLRTASSAAPLGAVTLAATAASGRVFTPEMVTLAEELARRAAVAIDNARLYERAQREIAERARAERQAERVSSDLRLVTDAAPLLISYIGSDLRYRFVNQGYAEWFGTPKERIVGMSVPELIGSAAFEKARPLVERALTGERVSFETLLPYAEGARPRHVHVEMVPDIAPVEQGESRRSGGSSGGRVRGYVTVLSDISARRAAEEERERLLAQMEAVLQSATDGIIVSDTEGNTLMWNAAALALHGYADQEQARWHLSAFPDTFAVYPPYVSETTGGSGEAQSEPLPLAEWPLARLVRGETFTDCEHKLRRLDTGVDKWVSYSGAVARDARGNPLLLVLTARDVSERVRAAAVLRESEARYRDLFESHPQPMLVYDIETLAFLMVNEAAVTHYGYGRNEWLSMKATDVRPPEERPRFQAVAATLPTLRHGNQGIWRHQKKDGTIIDVEIVSSPITFGGRPARIVSVTDVTERIALERERREAQERLRASDERYRTLFETAALGIVYQDQDAAIIDANPAAQRILGMTLDQMQGRTSLDPRWKAVKEDGSDFPGDQHPVPRALASCQIERAVMGVFHPQDEAYRWIDVTAVPKCDVGDVGGNRPHLVYALFEDITERRRAEAARREGEERFRALADNIAQLAWMADASGSIFWYNRRWFEYTGTTLEEMQGWGWQKVHDPERVDAIARRFREHVEAGEPWEDTFPLRGADGQFRWFLSRAFPTRDESGKVVLWCGTNTDITEQREAAQRQRRFLKEMLAGFTEHRLQLCFGPEELPTPLPPLSDPAQVPSPAAIRSFRKNIEAVAEGLGIPKQRSGDFLTACHEAASNAVRYGGAGGGMARVHGDRDTGRIQVWVEDQGPGIAEEMIHRAVERGFTTGGFGQGFHLMLSCADHLYLYSEAGRGTTVVLEMDREAPEPAWLRSFDR